MAPNPSRSVDDTVVFPPRVTQPSQAYLDALPIAACMVSLRGDRVKVLATNAAFEALDGLSRESDGRALVERDEIGGALKAFPGCGKPVHRFEWRDGERVAGRHFLASVSHLDAAADCEDCAMLTLVDRTTEVENERSLRSEMLHDSLTGLPNRTAFSELVEQASAHAAHAVLVVDLTRFSRVNECVGAVAGDELIITVARRMLASLRSHDVLARLGGDEFGVLLAVHEGEVDAFKAATRLRRALSTPFRLSELEISIDCAIGLALLGDSAAQTDEAIRNAQFAMKRAKSTGKVECYKPAEANAVRRRFSLETELRRALEAGALDLAFQPVLDLPGGDVIGFEALARWTIDGKPVSPLEFIAVAEESGLIVQLGRWALDRAVCTLAMWDREAGGPLPLRMAVNLSAIQLARDDIVAAVDGALSAHGISGERLTLELTESAIVQDPERSLKTLLALKALDTIIAMDDFGTGYSNLAYLQRLPIDVLKIDRSFVSGMLDDPDKLAIVRAVLSLAAALGMKTVAEGVETLDLADTLGRLGCDSAQGYYYAKPMPAAEAFAYWRERRR